MTFNILEFMIMYDNRKMIMCKIDDVIICGTAASNRSGTFSTVTNNLVKFMV